MRGVGVKVSCRREVGSRERWQATTRAEERQLRGGGIARSWVWRRWGVGVAEVAEVVADV